MRLRAARTVGTALFGAGGRLPRFQRRLHGRARRDWLRPGACNEALRMGACSRDSRRASPKPMDCCPDGTQCLALGGAHRRRRRARSVGTRTRTLDQLQIQRECVRFVASANWANGGAYALQGRYRLPALARKAGDTDWSRIAGLLRIWLRLCARRSSTSTAPLRSAWPGAEARWRSWTVLCLSPPSKLITCCQRSRGPAPKLGRHEEARVDLEAPLRWRQQARTDL